MKRLKLDLDQLSNELETLDPEYLRGIKGGYGDTGEEAEDMVDIMAVIQHLP